MTNSDINIGVFQNSSSYRLYDMWSLTHEPPTNDTVRGGTYDLVNVKYTPKDPKVSGSLYKLQYERKFDTLDVNDRAIKLVINCL